MRFTTQELLSNTLDSHMAHLSQDGGTSTRTLLQELLCSACRLSEFAPLTHLCTQKLSETRTMVCQENNCSKLFTHQAYYTSTKEVTSLKVTIQIWIDVLSQFRPIQKEGSGHVLIKRTGYFDTLPSSLSLIKVFPWKMSIFLAFQCHARQG